MTELFMMELLKLCLYIVQKNNNIQFLELKFEWGQEILGLCYAFYIVTPASLFFINFRDWLFIIC